MTIPNRVTLEDFEKMAAKDASRLPVDMLFEIEGEVIDLVRRAKDLQGRLSKTMDLKYGDTADGERKGDYGKVSLSDSGYVVECSKPKSVKWDSEGLLAIAKELAAQGEDPNEYMEIKASVPENSFKSWPSGLRERFEPFRSEKAGSATYKILRG